MGETVKIGYFAQQIPDMDDSRRVIDYIRDVAEYIPTTEGNVSASQMLERFLFTPEMQYAPVGKLSGGEKKRLYLLKIIFSAPNVFLFDEITNDLDIPTITILEDYINSFEGIVIAVSMTDIFWIILQIGFLNFREMASCASTRAVIQITGRPKRESAAFRQHRRAGRSSRPDSLIHPKIGSKTVRQN